LLLFVDASLHLVCLAYQPPANSTFLSEQTSHQQPASSTFLSEQISIIHQPPAKRTGRLSARKLGLLGRTPREGCTGAGMLHGSRWPEQLASFVPSGQCVSSSLPTIQRTFLPSYQPLPIFWFPLLAAATTASLPALWRGEARFQVRRCPPSAGAGAKLDAWVDPERGLSPAPPLPVRRGSVRLLRCSSTGERPCLPLQSCRRRSPSVATSTGGLLPLSRATAQIWQQRPELGLSPWHGGHGRSLSRLDRFWRHISCARA
jgi:hypothetical protein